MAEYVCFHLLEDSGDMDDAKVLLRDLAYSVAEQHELSNKFRLFARFCGVLQVLDSAGQFNTEHIHLRTQKQRIQICRQAEKK